MQNKTENKDQPLSVTKDPRFTHWVQPLAYGGEKGEGQYWYTNADDAHRMVQELNATTRFRFGASGINPDKSNGQPKGVLLQHEEQRQD